MAILLRSSPEYCYLALMLIPCEVKKRSNCYLCTITFLSCMIGIGSDIMTTPQMQHKPPIIFPNVVRGTTSPYLWKEMVTTKGQWSALYKSYYGVLHTDCSGRIWKKMVHFQNASNVFRQHYSIGHRNLKTQQKPVILKLCLRKTRAGKSQSHRLRKAPFLVVDTRSVETTIAVGQNMQMCHSLRCKQIDRSTGTQLISIQWRRGPFLRESLILVAAAHAPVTEGCALTAPGRLRRLTFGLGRLKKKSGRPSRRLVFGLCENPKRNQRTHWNGAERNKKETSMYI